MFGPVDFSRPFVHEEQTQLYYTPLYRDLARPHRLRYNQIFGVRVNEQFMALERDLTNRLLVRLIGQMYGPGPDGGGDWAEGRTDDGAPADPRADPRAKRVQLDDLLDRVVRLGGSDLHLTVGSPPVVRLQGELRRMEGLPPLNGSDARRMIFNAPSKTEALGSPGRGAICSPSRSASAICLPEFLISSRRCSQARARCWSNRAKPGRP